MRTETAELLLDSVTKRLKLPTIRQQYRSLAREAEERNLSYEAYLLALLEQEVLVREANQKQQKLQRATFPIRKTLDTFDFHLLPSLNRNRVLTLSQGEFVQKKENIFMLGNSGTGNYRKYLVMERNERTYCYIKDCTLISFDNTSE